MRLTVTCVLFGLALALGLGLRHNTRPPAGLRNPEALTTDNLVYAF